MDMLQLVLAAISWVLDSSWLQPVLSDEIFSQDQLVFSHVITSISLTPFDPT